MVDFRLRGEAGVMAGLRNIVRKKNGGKGASSRGFVGRIDFIAFCVGDSTQVGYSLGYGGSYPPPIPGFPSASSFYTFFRCSQWYRYF